jgi:hypothetical protein
LATWDPDLSAAMNALDKAVHEEAVLPSMLEALGELLEA